jgi:hypothetical protein
MRLTRSLSSRRAGRIVIGIDSPFRLWPDSRQQQPKPEPLFGSPGCLSSRIFQRRAQIERRLPEFPLTTPEGNRRKVAPL